VKFLCINPGSTSTRIAVFTGDHADWSMNVKHKNEELEKFERIQDQLDYRFSLISDALKENGVDLHALSAVAGRGGALRPIEGGVYAISEAMLADCRSGAYAEHPSNLGCQLALMFSQPLGIPAFVVDPPLIDEFEEVSRITGLPELKRTSAFHPLNQKAVADLAAGKLGKRTEELNIVTVHMGSGISVTSHKKGRCIDNNYGSGGDGPFSPERCGRLPALALLEEIASEDDPDEAAWKKSFSKKSGIVSYLGTNDVPELEERVARGDGYAKDVLDAMAHLIAKEVAAYCAAMGFQVDAVGITGAIARSDYIVGRLTGEISFIAPTYVFPGEFEMEALAKGAFKALTGEVQVKTY